MMKRNTYFEKIPGRYLFQEMRLRVQEFRKKNPDAALISLGIGDTTEPITPHITKSLQEAASALGTQEGYSGYGPEQGWLDLRKAISVKIYAGKVSPDDIFISDGAKCDIGRLQFLFGNEARIALQDPTYPVYLDTSILYRGTSPILLPCTPENDFVPDLSLAKNADVLFLCLPNNPTGTCLTYEQLEEVVTFAKKSKTLIVFDAAYSFFVKEGYPKSIYEVPGADSVAIELGSFSKMAGFSGIRLSWTVIPEKLTYSDAQYIKPDWMRINSTFFNGASILSQKGGLHALSDTGLCELQKQIDFYSENIGILKNSLVKKGHEVYGGTHSPYLWLRLQGLRSWQAFDSLLEEAHLVTTPGIGFGPAGDQFLRISGFASRPNILTAAERLANLI